METLVKILCGNTGCMEHERVLDLSYGLTELSDLDQILQNSDIFTVVQHTDRKYILLKTEVRLCKNAKCDDTVCGDLHVCKYELMTGQCDRSVCDYGHTLMCDRNMKVLEDHHMSALTREELSVVLLQNDSNILPPVCVLYNRGDRPYGRCSEKEKCTRLHMCESYIRGRCDVTDCFRSHDFFELNTLRILKRRGVSDHLMSCLPLIYRNILMLKDHRNRQLPVHHRRRCGSDICLSFVKGFCKNRECSRIHFRMPYKWEVKVDNIWTALPNNEKIEKEYCDPFNIYSSGNEPVCFEDMTLGLDEVRRLSTEPSVLLPTFVLTTTWIWYWRDEYENWIQYASVKEMHRMSTISSDELEKRYQEYLQLRNPSEQDSVVMFRAGKQFYQLNFKDMTQRNEVSGTERPVRRRPVFVSSVDVQMSKTSRKSSWTKPHISKGVPGFWDKKAIPACGFQRICLQQSDRDYMRVQDLFCDTMSSFTITQIERVQNRELWEIFMIKKEAMKKANNERVGERLLFHDIKSSLVDVVCCKNFSIEMSDTSVYGKGIYFSKDAQTCIKNTDECGGGMMFVCRVLLGHYTRGHARFHQPPPKKNTADQYDSCVDNPRDPSVFVLFDRSQIYPEFIITYEQKKTPEVSRTDTRFPMMVMPVTQVNVTDVKQTSETSDVRTNSCSEIKSSSVSGSEQTSASSCSSRETLSHSAVCSSILNTNPNRVPVPDVPNTDVKPVEMKNSDEILQSQLKSVVKLQPAVQLHVDAGRSDSKLKTISSMSASYYSSGNIQDIPEVRSSPSLRQLGSISRDSTVAQCSDAVNLANRPSDSGEMRVSSAPSLWHSDECVSNSRQAIREEIIHQHAVRRQHRDENTETKKCTVM